MSKLYDVCSHSIGTIIDGFQYINEFKEAMSASDMRNMYVLLKDTIKDVAKFVVETAETLPDNPTKEEIQETVVRLIDDRIQLPFIIDNVLNLDGVLIRFIVELIFDKFWGDENVN